MSERSKPRNRRKSQAPTRKARARAGTSARGNGDARRPASKQGLRKRANGSANGADARHLLALGNAKARSAPEVRPDLVARYKKLIAEGRYHPDPLKIADKMIRKGLLKDL